MTTPAAKSMSKARWWINARFYAIEDQEDVFQEWYALMLECDGPAHWLYKCKEAATMFLKKQRGIPRRGQQREFRMICDPVWDIINPISFAETLDMCVPTNPNDRLSQMMFKLCINGNAFVYFDEWDIIDFFKYKNKKSILCSRNHQRFKGKNSLTSMYFYEGAFYRWGEMAEIAKKNGRRVTKFIKDNSIRINLEWA